ncbi:MAG TPA: four helix bundle protein [bacterium]
MAMDVRAPKIISFRDLQVFQDGYRLAMEVFKITREFPSEERYSLTSQMLNSSRSIPANIAEGWAKRQFERVFKRHLLDSIGSANEMLVWIDTAADCGYITVSEKSSFLADYDVLGRQLNQLFEKWKTY